DRRTNKLDRFSYSSTGNSISNNIIRGFIEDSKGFLWVGTEGGLNRFDPVKEEWFCLRHDNSEQNSLSNNTVWCMREAWGALWVGTDNGLNKLVYDSL